MNYFTKAPSRGGLVEERWSDNRLDSATVGSNLHQVWCINRSEGETPLLLIHNIAERRAFEFMIHALMLAVKIRFVMCNMCY